MKMKIFAALVGMVIVTAGCVSTVSGTHSPALTWSKDQVGGRYERSVDQVYQASVQVIQNNGVLLTEYIPHDSTNMVRSLQGKVNERNVWTVSYTHLVGIWHRQTVRLTIACRRKGKTAAHRPCALHKRGVAGCEIGAGKVQV